MVTSHEDRLNASIAQLDMIYTVQQSLANKLTGADLKSVMASNMDVRMAAQKLHIDALRFPESIDQIFGDAAALLESALEKMPSSDAVGKAYSLAVLENSRLLDDEPFGVAVEHESVKRTDDPRQSGWQKLMALLKRFWMELKGRGQRISPFQKTGKHVYHPNKVTTNDTPVSTAGTKERN